MKTVDVLEKEVEEHENKLRDIELEIEAEDAVIPRGFAKTYTPTKEEYDRHCLTHLPYRSWCPICIQAKKKNIAHKKTKSDRGVPVYSIDKMFLNGKDSLANPVLVMTEWWYLGSTRAKERELHLLHQQSYRKHY